VREQSRVYAEQALSPDKKDFARVERVLLQLPSIQARHGTRWSA
jgi:hypothetical protein